MVDVNTQSHTGRPEGGVENTGHSRCNVKVRRGADRKAGIVRRSRRERDAGSGHKEGSLGSIRTRVVGRAASCVFWGRGEHALLAFIGPEGKYGKYYSVD
jgi:hypothetical protein